jgi:hypothetical protein
VLSVRSRRGPSGMPFSELASPKPPLHKFPICDSRKVDDWAAAALPIFGPTQVEPKGDAEVFRALINLCPLPRTAHATGGSAARSALASRTRSALCRGCRFEAWANTSTME